MFTRTSEFDEVRNYLQKEFPTLLRVGPIASGLQKYGKFSPKDVETVLKWNDNQEGPSVGIIHRGASRIWDTVLQQDSQVVFLNWWLAAEFQVGKQFWNKLTAAGREHYGNGWKQQWLGLSSPDSTKAQGAFQVGKTFDKTFFFYNKSGKRIWALGAVLLESLVRLGCLRKGLNDYEAQQQSTAFQSSVYDSPVVDIARSLLSMRVDDIKKGVYGQDGKDALTQGDKQ
jgi:hypothetical protein